MSNGMMMVPRVFLERILADLDVFRSMVEVGPTGVDAELRELLSAPEPTITADTDYLNSVLGNNFQPDIHDPVSIDGSHVFHKGLNTLEQVDGKYIVKMAFASSDDAVPAFKEVCRLSEQ